MDGQGECAHWAAQDRCLRFPFPVTVTNLPEDDERETETIVYRSFEMLTVKVDPARAKAWLR